MAWDRYAYGLDNPVKYLDPTGHYVFEEEPDDSGIYSDGRIRSTHYFTHPDYEQGQPSDAEILITLGVVLGGAPLAGAALSDAVAILQATWGFGNEALLRFAAWCIASSSMCSQLVTGSPSNSASAADATAGQVMGKAALDETSFHRLFQNGIGGACLLTEETYWQ